MNHGFIPDEPQGEDYIFGASPIPYTVLQENGDWTPFLPDGEAQNLNGIEPYACTAFTILNCVEMLIQRKYNETRNYSDRFLAAVSGTKVGGNSPQVVCEFLRKVGVAPEEAWPFTVHTFEEFYAPLPPKLYELAKEFTDEWEFKHEYVPSTPAAIQKALKCSPLGISVYAWTQDETGLYYKPKGVKDNHFTTLINVVPGRFKEVFDSYDSFLKTYDWNEKHMVIKRFYIAKKPPKHTAIVEWFNWFFREIFR